jgi:hypothetical protein
MTELSIFEKALAAHTLHGKSGQQYTTLFSSLVSQHSLDRQALSMFVNSRGELDRIRAATEVEFNCKPDIIPIEIMAHQLSFWQKETLLDTLRNDAGKTPDADIITTICSKTNLESSIVEAYVKSYRFNNQQGAIARLAGVVDTERALAPKADIKPIPTPRAAGSNSTGAVPVANADGGKVAQILALHDQGLSNNEIIERGYNKSTVYRQVHEYKQRKAAAKK